MELATAFSHQIYDKIYSEIEYMLKYSRKTLFLATKFTRVCKIVRFLKNFSNLI